MKQLSEGGNESKAKALDLLEDVSDYYERSLQLRCYRITSLEEELKEANTKTNTIKKYATRGWWAARICILIVILSLLELFNPGVLKQTFYNQSTLSHIGAALVSIIGFNAFSKYANA